MSYFIRNATSCCVLNINNKQKLLRKRIHLALKEPAITFNSQRIRSVNLTITQFARLLYKVFSLIHLCYPWDLLNKGFCILVITIRATFTRIFITKAVLNYHDTRIQFKPHSSFYAISFHYTNFSCGAIAQVGPTPSHCWGF